MSMINGTNVVVAGGTFNINNPQTATEYILQIFGNNYVPSATHDNNDILNSPKCHPGTRTSFLSRLSNWVEDTKSPIYLTWLHGPAGAGKSAIARSLAENLHHNRLLAASFFFFRTDSRRNSEKPSVMTLAYQISRSIPDTRTHIANTVKDDPTVTSMSLKTQFEKLIIDPLIQITTDKSKSFRPMLIIVDGLDECVERHSRNLILELLFDAHPYLHGHIKFLVVSRPEYDIQRSFDSVVATPKQCINTINLEGDLQAYEDVRTYLRDHFRRITKTHPLREHFPLDWPSNDAIERLVEKSSGHFIYASTVIKFIENDFDRPQERLDIIINLRSTSQNPYAALDALYLNILTSSRAGHALTFSRAGHASTSSRAKHALTSSRPEHALLVNILSIVVLDAPFNNNRDLLSPVDMTSVHFVESVLSLKPGGVQLALLDLKSLVGVDKNIRFWHQSFSDFLHDSSRSDKFYTSSASAYTLIAKGCLRLLIYPGSLERSWSGIHLGYPTASLKCHHLLSFCYERADVDLDLQTTMMGCNFNETMPSGYDDPFGSSVKVVCSCLRNYQKASIVKGTTGVGGLRRQFDQYLISELRRSVPLESEIMGVLRTIVSSLRVKRKTSQKVKKQKLFKISSSFLCYMYYNTADPILCEFFYSKDRSCEYYLGEPPPELLSLKRKSSPSGPELTLQWALSRNS